MLKCLILQVSICLLSFTGKFWFEFGIATDEKISFSHPCLSFKNRNSGGDSGQKSEGNHFQKKTEQIVSIFRPAESPSVLEEFDLQNSRGTFFLLFRSEFAESLGVHKFKWGPKG